MHLLLNFYILSSINLPINLLCLNIRSLRNKFDTFKLFLDSQHKKIHIIVLTEVWIKVEELSRYQLHGYKAILEENKNNQAGGVLIYYDENLSCSYYCSSTGTFNSVSCSIKIKVDNKETTLSILGLYRFCGSSIQNFITDLENILKDLNKNCILMGDINIDLLNLNYSSDYVNFLYSCGFTESFHEITRKNLGNGSCIDHVFFRTPKFGLDSKLESVSFSDHKCIFVNFHDFALTKNNKSKLIQNFCKLDNSKFTSYLQSYNIEKLHNIQCVNTAFNTFLMI